MNFLKNLFGGSGGRRDDRGLYVYVRPKACQEILRVRIDMMNDLSQSDDGDGYFTRKLARGHRCPFPVEMVFYFDKNRQMRNQTIENGEFVNEEAYNTWAAAQEDRP